MYLAGTRLNHSAKASLDVREGNFHPLPYIEMLEIRISPCELCLLRTLCDGFILALMVLISEFSGNRV
jgi:hypothetical protein